jgi:hypothetical protein
LYGLILWLATMGSAGAGNVEEAVALRSAGDLEGASAALRTHLDADPADTLAWRELAVTHAWAGELEDAEAAWGRVVDAEPEDLGAKVGLATVIGWRGRLVRARQMLLEVLDEDDAHLEARAALARLDQARRRHGSDRRGWDAYEALGGSGSEAQQGRDALRSDARGEVRASVGAGWAAEQTSFRASAAAAWDLSAKARLHGDWSFSRLDLGGQTGTGSIHQGAVGITWRPRTGIWLDTKLAARNGWLGGGLELAGDVGPVVLSVSAVSGSGIGANPQGPDLFANAGIRHGDTRWIDTRGFLYLRADGYRSGAFLLSGGWGIKTVEPRLNGGFSRDPFGWWGLAGAEVRVRIKRHVIAPRVSARFGPWFAVEGDLGWEVTF